MVKEIWKSIPGHPGYEVSDQGHVRSVDRFQDVVVNGKVQHRHYRGRNLKPAAYCKTGHLSLPLGRKTHGIPVHRLVLLAFEGPCPEGKEVLHKNDVSTDNRLENLRYGTRTENILDTYKNRGRWKGFSEKEARQVLDMYEFGISKAEISRLTGVSQSSIGKLLNGGSYTWLQRSVSI